MSRGINSVNDGGDHRSDIARQRSYHYLIKNQNNYDKRALDASFRMKEPPFYFKSKDSKHEDTKNNTTDQGI